MVCVFGRSLPLLSVFLNQLPLFPPSGNPCFGRETQEAIYQLSKLRGIHRASFVGNVERMVMILKTRGKTVSGKRQTFVTTEDGDTPLHCAVMGDQVQAVRLLLAYGADPTVRNLSGRRPIDVVRSDEVQQELLRESLETVKMVVLGHGRVGKTTAVKAIKELEAGQHAQWRHRGTLERSTIGLDVSSLIVPKRNDEEKETNIRVWDFA